MTEAEATIGKSAGDRPNLLMVWAQASRIWTLTLASVGVLVGTAAAVYYGFGFSLERFILAELGATALQAATNMINDYYDYVQGTDRFDELSQERIGPGMAIQQNLVTPDQLWWGAMAAFAVGSILGLILVYQCGWVILAIGLLSVAGGYFYTAPPISIAYHGLGDLAVFLFMGPGFILGGYYVQALSFSWGALAAAIPMGCLASGVLQVNNMRDIENDRRHNKHTFAAIVGRPAAIAELIGTDVLAFAIVILGVVMGVLPWPAVAVLLTVPRAVKQVQLVRTATDWRNMNEALNLTAQFHLEFGLLLTAALLLGHLV
jgi:1,4-dihydroxy-2-naphthoate polyprenyltransferase